MKRSLFFILPAAFAFNLSSVNALEIDQKLTLRFLKVSSSKKTVLINRGGEDGLVVGDHAKFFITAGVVARGVSEKVSPSRSVWSLYRIVDPQEITQDKVLNLKIATPVKITADPSKSLKDEPIPGGTETMNVAEEGASEEVAVNEEEKSELKELGGRDGSESDLEAGAEEVEAPKKTAAANKKSEKEKVSKNVSVVDDTPTYSSNTSRTWEVWGTMYFNSLSGTSEVPNSTGTIDSYSSTSSTIDFSGGVEKYFLNSSNFFKEVSVSIFLHKKTIENGSDTKVTADWLEYGLGASYHFYNSAASVNRLVGYGLMSVGKGSTSIETKTTANGTSAGEPIEGSNTFLSVGVGAKYVLSNGFGLRTTLDYYRSSESYTFDDSTSTSTIAGPRIQLGLSYRF